ncbi:MAG TPA: hypothetical protein VNG53_05630 [Bacteroidia bacterium]|nr:hypothetical protein [Bacteroidia bacterium]
MISKQEQLLVKKFVVKDKQDRYLAFLSKEKTRKKFTEALYHFNDFNWKLFREIPGSENEGQTISLKVKSAKNISTCSVISADPNLDGNVLSVDEAIKNAIGIEGTILIFGDADIVYYEGEAPKRRYISI